MGLKGFDRGVWVIFDVSEPASRVADKRCLQHVSPSVSGGSKAAMDGPPMIADSSDVSRNNTKLETMRDTKWKHILNIVTVFPYKSWCYLVQCSTDVIFLFISIISDEFGSLWRIQKIYFGFFMSLM